MRVVKELAPPENRAYCTSVGRCLEVLCVLSRNSPPRKTGLIVRLWADAWRILPPGKQGSYCACCQGTRLWHHFPSSRAASFWVDLYFILPQRMVLYSYSENGNAQQVPSFLVSFFSDFMSTLYRLSLSLSDYLLSFLVHARFHARFHACPLPPSLCLFPGKAFMSMLPAVLEKFSRREVF